jgi:paraquat-inducible protein B
LKQAESTLASIEGVTADNSPLQYELTRALKNLSDAARALGHLAESLERHPEALIRGKSR